MARVFEEIDPELAISCSDITLCSNPKGFFTTLTEELITIASEDWLQEFEKVEESKKLAFFKENQKIAGALSEVLSRIEPLHRRKSAILSIERRDAALKSLEEGDLTKALALASEAVLKAPMTGEQEFVEEGVTLALALWVRSEVLLGCSFPNAALQDLKMAFKERLPVEMRAHYYWRMGHCYKGGGEPTKAKVSYEVAGRLLGTNEEAREQLARDMKSLDHSVTPKQHPPDKIDIELAGGAQQNMPSLSKLLKICEEETKGRFVAAAANIGAGDVVLVDSAYAACLRSEHYGSHCLNCFKRLINCEESAPIWCPKCSGVAFCSIQCRDEAVSTYHSYECQFTYLFIGSGMSILSHIALRMVTQAGLDASLSIHAKYLSNERNTVEGTVLNNVDGVENKMNETCKEPLNRSEKGLENFANLNLSDEHVETNVQHKMSFEEKVEPKVAQIYSLVTHSDQRRGDDYLKRIAMAMFLTECLKKAGFFKTCEKENLEKAHTSISELLVRNLQLVQFNAHELYETIRGEHMFNGSRRVYMAVGVFPVGALFNHECDPAVTRYFVGRNLVLTATRPLSPGEVVSENYGPHFLARSLGERQRTLACRYWFKCRCPACLQDWCTLKQMPKQFIYLRCPNVSCSWKFRVDPARVPHRCVKCSVSIGPKLVKANLRKVNKCIVEYKKGAKLMEKERPEEAIRTFCAAIDSFYEVALQPNKDTQTAQEALRSCLATKGNNHKVDTIPEAGQAVASAEDRDA